MAIGFKCDALFLILRAQFKVGNTRRIDLDARPILDTLSGVPSTPSMCRVCDVSLLPLEARTVGSAEFGEAIHRYLTREFEGFSGSARIVVSDKLIQVIWDPGTDNPDPIQPAMEKLNCGRLPQAIQLLELLRSQRPNDVDILLNLGMALSETGKPDRAAAHLRKLLALKPNHTGGHIALGVALARQNKPDEAIKELRTALEFEPDNPDASRNLAACLLRMRKESEAEEILRRVVKISPSD
jgi:tetratricopeptide (TPR) repeat protein